MRNASTPTSIFISYRREDSAPYAGRLSDDLARRFPDSNIFMDIDTIGYGVDFGEEIQKAVTSCDVLIAVIGKRWLTVADENGSRRLDSPDDWVRLEIGTALSSDIRVIPILLPGTTMPSPKDLPPEIVKLARLNALDISDRRWDYDISLLTETLKGILPKQTATPAQEIESVRGHGLVKRFQVRIRRSWSISARARNAFATVIALAVLFTIAWMVVNRQSVVAPNSNRTPDHNSNTTSATQADQPFVGITRIAENSSLAHVDWINRGVAPPGYIKGMAVVYARTYCKLKDGDAAATEMAKARTEDNARDALAWLADEFQAVNMNNDQDGSDTLRHLFVLLIGLGMQESSGRYCEGLDVLRPNATAGTAETGLFQTSLEARDASPLMKRLFKQYLANQYGFVEIFSEGVNCGRENFRELGSGDGFRFQKLSKDCPAFAVEFTALGLRNIRTHWGPIVRREVEIRPESDEMLRQVQAAVDALGLCPIFKSN